jgi:hypothetical protein
MNQIFCGQQNEPLIEHLKTMACNAQAANLILTILAGPIINRKTTTLKV